jgi:DNA-binding LacI/PurR family transcriptional regulator
VAAQAGVSVPTVGRWERERKVPSSAETRRKVAELVGRCSLLRVERLNYPHSIALTRKEQGRWSLQEQNCIC